MLHTCLSTLHFVELDSELIEDAADTGVIRKHHSTYFVLCGNIWTFLSKSNLDRCWTPWDEVGKFSLSDSLKRLMHLSGVNITLYYIQDRDVASLLYTFIDQDVLWLEETTHHIKHRSFTNRIHSAIHR